MTIPKIIYTTWISYDPLPKKFEEYIETWKKTMPDYEIRFITIDTIDKSIPFVAHYLEKKEYATVGNYYRCKELYDNGGIYLDADIEAVKPLDDLLNQECFVGLEDPGVVNCAVIGSIKGHPFMKACLDYMDSYDFRPQAVLETGPWMFSKLHPEQYGVKVYPERYFYPYSYRDKFKPECVTPDTYLIHHWQKSWEHQ